MIRHPDMPNHVECCTKPVLRWISEHCLRALVNMMRQYHPDHKVPLERSTHADIMRRPTPDEMRSAYDFTDSLGLLYSPVSWCAENYFMPYLATASVKRSLPATSFATIAGKSRTVSRRMASVPRSSKAIISDFITCLPRRAPVPPIATR